MHEVETLFQSTSITFDRVIVPGGWIYRTFSRGIGGGVAVAATFVAEPPPKSALDWALEGLESET